MTWIKGKRYTQWGTALITLLLPCIVLFTILLAKVEYVNMLFYLHLFISVFLLCCLLCFYNLTITVDNMYVSFKMGIGLIRKRYKISNVKSCKPITCSSTFGAHFLNGFGIRFFPNGVQYNVSGFKAIELQFHDRDTVIRIGTNQPEEISQQIQSLMDGNIITDYLIPPGKKWNYWLEKWRWVIALVIAVIVFAGTLRGHFKLSKGTRTTVFLKTKHKPYLFIELKNNQAPVFLNFSDRQKTINLYNQLKNKQIY